jgi:predicted nucleic acid-binding Zn ribbon protein
MVNAYGQHVGGGERPWQLDVIERLVAAGRLRYCDVCGRPMAPKRRGGDAKYCSWECQREAGRYRARQRKRRLR